MLKDLSLMVIWRPRRPSRTNTQKRCPFHYRGLECKSRKSRNAWSYRHIWPWSTEWSRAKAKRAGHNWATELNWTLLVWVFWEAHTKSDLALLELTEVMPMRENRREPGNVKKVVRPWLRLATCKTEREEWKEGFRLQCSSKNFYKIGSPWAKLSEESCISQSLTRNIP